jgi:hypothetical protein
MKLLIMQFLHPPVASSLLGSNILLSTLFLYTLNVISHPYKGTGKSIVYTHVF